MIISLIYKSNLRYLYQIYFLFSSLQNISKPIIPNVLVEYKALASDYQTKLTVPWSSGENGVGDWDKSVHYMIKDRSTIFNKECNCNDLQLCRSEIPNIIVQYYFNLKMF